MISKLKRVLKDERGITGLETAIILVAFVVVAAVFSFAVLSAGTYSTQKSEEAVYAGLSEVRSTLELKGTVYAAGSGSGEAYTVTNMIFNVSNVAGGEPVDLTAPATGNHRMVIDYLDENQRVADLVWTVSFKGYNDADNLLEEGEMAEVTVPLNGTGKSLSPELGIDTDFVIEVKPERGGTLVIEKRTPATINTYMALD